MAAGWHGYYFITGGNKFVCGPIGALKNTQLAASGMQQAAGTQQKVAGGRLQTAGSGQQADSKWQGHVSRTHNLSTEVFKNYQAQWRPRP